MRLVRRIKDIHVDVGIQGYYRSSGLADPRRRHGADRTCTDEETARQNRPYSGRASVYYVP